MKKKKGTYLIIELAFIICLLAIMAAAGIVNFEQYNYEAKVNTAQNEVMQLGNAVAHYKYDTGKLPDTLDVLAVPGSGELEGYGPWITEIKKDPWGNAYILVPGTDKKEFVVFCTENEVHQSNSGGGDSLEQGVIGFHGL